MPQETKAKMKVIRLIEMKKKDSMNYSEKNDGERRARELPDRRSQRRILS